MYTNLYAHHAWNALKALHYNRRKNTRTRGWLASASFWHLHKVYVIFMIIKIIFHCVSLTCIVHYQEIIRCSKQGVAWRRRLKHCLSETEIAGSIPITEQFLQIRIPVLYITVKIDPIDNDFDFFPCKPVQNAFVFLVIIYFDCIFIIVKIMWRSRQLDWNLSF